VETLILGEAEDSREATIELLRICNKAENLMELMRNLSLFFQRLTGCEAVGVRIRQGDDFPYYETLGFPGEFVLAENRLCAFDQAGGLIRDGSGHPALDCMCGNILCGRFDPSKPFFSAGGSFWSNCTTEMLASTSDTDRQAKTRNRCNGEGYESVALVPLRSQGETFGLFQFNDKRRGRFTAEMIAMLEDLATYVAIGVAKQKADEVLRSSEESYRSLFGNMAEGYAHCRMIFNGGRPEDFIYINVNEAFGTLTGLTDVVGKKVSEVIPGIRESDARLFEVYGRVALTGKPERFEIYVEALSHWFSVSVYSPKKEHFVAVFDVITERKRAEEALRESEIRYRSIFNYGADGIVIIDPDTATLIDFNEQACTQLGYTRGEFGGLTISDIDLLEGTEEIKAHIRQIISAGYDEFETVHRTKLGERRNVHIKAQYISIGGKSVFHCIWRDITDRKRSEAEREKLQAQLQQAMKMEAVGRLAGGVAHDFNNLLTVITGYSELLLQKIGEESRMHMELEEIQRAGERAAALTQQLLAFSRKQIIEPKVVHLDHLVAETHKMLTRLIGEDIALQATTGKSLGSVKVDPGQFQQILMNLVVNARDAMPDGGKIVIETANVDLDEGYCALRPYVKPGRFVMLAVSDTGHGMTEEVKERIFEPFFTTKEQGSGTGLGLATTYGIVKQAGGSIEAYSEVGIGTTIKIHLPRVEEQAANPVKDDRPTDLPGGTETVLIVEDEGTLRKLCVQILELLGYRVLQARNGSEAIAVVQGTAERIELLMTDVVMPGMNGNELATRLALHNPELKVLFTSGYTEDVISHHGVLAEGVSFIGKPYTPSSLARKVREVLGKA